MPDFTTLGICANCTFAHDEGQTKPPENQTLQNFIKGLCNYQNCCFAHGEDELRSINDLYKTALSYNYNQGKCQNGEQICSWI